MLLEAIQKGRPALGAETVILVGLTGTTGRLKDGLQRLGLCPVQYDDPTQAMIGLIRLRPAAAIVGVRGNAEDLDGILRAIRKSNPGAGIAVVAGCHSRSQEIAARERGVVFFGTRPVEESVLLEVVKAAVAANGRKGQGNGNETRRHY